MPKISVIIPVYNVEKYLKKCLESIINQTYRDIEIICVDDGSTDSSLSILEEYAKKDDRFIVISQDNGGQGVARNRALDIAKGEYISFIDSDDYIEPTYLEEMFNAFELNECELVISNIENFCDTNSENINNLSTVKQIIDEDYKLSRIKDGIFDFELLHDIRLRFGPVAKLHKRNIIEQYHIRFPEGLVHEDIAFYWYYMARVHKVYGLDKKLYNRLIHETSTMYKLKISKEKLFDNVYILKEIYTYLKNNALYCRYKYLFRNYFYNVTNYILTVCETDDDKLSLQGLINEYEKSFALKPFWEDILSMHTEYSNGKKRLIIAILGLKLKLTICKLKK